MKKLLRTSDKILIALAFLGDLVMELHSYERDQFNWRKALYESLKVKKQTFSSSISRLLKTGEIEKVIDKKGRPCFKLKPSGLEKIERIFPLFHLSSKPWDGKWRVVIFDISEKERRARDYLRDKLVSLGFGKLQKSIYISPLNVLADLKEWLKENGFFGNVLIFEAKEMSSLDPKDVADYVWHLEELNKEYRKVIDKAEEIQEEKNDSEKKRKLKNEFFDLLLRDPILPREFLSEDWLGEKARRLILSLS